MLNQDKKDLKVRKFRTYNQVARGVRRVIYDMTPTKDLRTIYGMERKETLAEYNFTPMEIADALLKIEMKYNITLPIDRFPKYEELTLGKLIHETDCAISRKRLHPQTNNEIYYVFNQVLSAKGLSVNLMGRDRKLKEYEIGPWFALSLIQELEHQIGLNPCQISKEIEAMFNNSSTYDYYNEVSIEEIVRIASKHIQHANQKSAATQLSGTEKQKMLAFMNEYKCIVK